MAKIERAGVRLVVEQQQQAMRALQMASAGYRNLGTTVQQTAQQVNAAAGEYASSRVVMERWTETIDTSAEEAAAAAASMTQLGLALTAVGVAGKVGLTFIGLQASRIKELGILLEVTRQNAVNLAAAEGDLDKAASLNAVAVQKQVQGIRDLHLSGVVANETVAALIRYNLDWTRATELARGAQDAATFAAEDSSKALEGLIHGITTLQPRVLRTRGIMINLNEAYRDFAEANDLVAKDLTQSQRQQAAFNAVMEHLPKIAGAYEASLDAASKQIRSIQTDVINLAEAFGEEFEPALAQAVKSFRGVLKFLTALPDPLQSAIVHATGAGTALATLSGTALILAPRISALATAFAGLSLATKGLLGIGALIPIVVGAIAYFDEQKETLIELGGEILATSESYDDYIRQLDEAGLSTQALTEDTYDLIAAQEEERKQAIAQELVEFQKRLFDEINANQLAWNALGNAADESTAGWSMALDAMIPKFQKLADWLGINIDLTDNLAITAAEGLGFMYGSIENLEQLLSEMARDETMRMALGDPNFIANLRREFEDADPAVRRQIEAMILFADAIETGVLPESLEMHVALKELGFTTEEIARIMLIYVDALNLASQANEEFAATAEEAANTKLLDAISDALKKRERAEIDAARDRLKSLEKLERDNTKKRADLWRDYQAEIRKIEEDIVAFHEGTLDELLDLDRETAQDRTDAWRDHLRDIEDAERSFTESLEDLNRDRLRDLADLEREYAEDKKEALANLNDDLADMERDLAKEIEEIRADHLQDLLELEQDYAKQREDLLADFAQRAEDIEAKYSLVPEEPSIDELREALQEELRLLQEAREEQHGVASRREKEILAELEALKEKELAQLEEDKQEQLSLLEEQLEEEKAEKDAAYEQALADAQSAYEEQREQRLAQYQEDLADLQAQHIAERAEVERRYRERMSDLETQHAREKAEIDRRYQEKLVDIDTQYGREKALIIEKLNEQLAAADEKYEEGLTKIGQWYDDQRELINQKYKDQREDIKYNLGMAVLEAQAEFAKMPEAFKPVWGVLKTQAQQEAAAFVDAIIDEFQRLFDFFGIHSPSRLMEQFASDVYAGLENVWGKESIADMLDFDAQQANISAAMGSLQTSINTSVPPQQAALPMGMGGRSVTNTTANNLNVTAQYQQYQSESSLRDDLSLWNGMMRAWGR
jgi:hypothetical protein